MAFEDFSTYILTPGSGTFDTTVQGRLGWTTNRLGRQWASKDFGIGHFANRAYFTCTWQVSGPATSASPRSTSIGFSDTDLDNIQLAYACGAYHRVDVGTNVTDYAMLMQATVFAGVAGATLDAQMGIRYGTICGFNDAWGPYGAVVTLIFDSTFTTFKQAIVVQRSNAATYRYFYAGSSWYTALTSTLTGDDSNVEIFTPAAGLDLTAVGWIKTDPDSKITLAPNRIAVTSTVTAMLNFNDNRVYKDFTATPFGNEFEVKQDINLISSTGVTTNNRYAGLLSFSNALLDAGNNRADNGNRVAVEIRYLSATTYSLEIWEFVGTVQNVSVASPALTKGIPYTITLKRTASGAVNGQYVLTVTYPFSTVVHSTVTLNATNALTQTFKYFAPYNFSYLGTQTSAFDLSIGNLAIVANSAIVTATAAGTGVATATATATQITPATATGTGVATAAAIPIAYTTTSATAAGAGVATANAVPIGTTTLSASATGAGVATANAIPVGASTVSATATGAGVATGSAIRTATSTIVSSANGAGVATAAAAAASPPGQATATATAVATGSAIGLSRNSKPATAAGVATGSAINATATTAQYKTIRWRVLSRNQTTGLLQPVTGLTPTLKIVRDADSLCHDFTDRAFKPAPQCTTLNATMTPTDQTNMPGLYGYSWRIDGYGTAANEAYAILAQASDAADNYMAEDLIVIRNGAAQFGGLTPQESTRLYTDSPDTAAIVAALQATTIPANILEIRGQVLNGSGLSTDPWRPL